jgi:AbrB family looped-hinge helix DNA binding protein
MPQIKVKVTRNGQTTIPLIFREKYGIQEGTILFVEDYGTGILFKIPEWINEDAGTGNYSIDELKQKLDKERENWR